jgi:hypothetical protein
MRRRIPRFIAILIILGASFGIRAARAQSAARIEILSIESASFPALSLRFEAYDEQNQFIRGLQPGQVRVLEDEQARPLRELELLQPGVHFIAAYDLGPELSNRYAGVSRYEAIQTALLAWAQAQPAGTSDQFSLAANTGMQLIRSGDPAEWAAAISSYQPDLLAETPSLNALTRAVDLATDASPESHRKDAILFVTPLIFTWNQEAATNLAGRAAAQGVRINVWLVASESAAVNNPQIAQGLEALAAETGGQYRIFDGQNGLPDPDDYLEPLRYVYRAAYDSQINAAGTHNLRLEIDYAGGLLSSASKPLFINVEPPNPIFLSPPSLIERKWVKEDGQKESRLLPDSTGLRIVIEFPDGHERPLKSSRLYVDGALAAENTAAPFDAFHWDLSGITSDGQHMLRVEVEDVLGLIKSSIEWPVDLTVEPQRTAPLQAVFTGKRLLTLGAILASGAVLILALILSGRQSRERRRAIRKAQSDPLTQPVPARIEPPSRPRKGSVRTSSERTTIPRRATSEFGEAKAWLMRVSENGAATRADLPPQPATAIPLIRRETTIGSDPRRALYRLDAATVSGLHARIQMTPEGEYRIFDSGSVAGTWVNYAPVPSQGLLLKHGDLIQIGREAFRFQLAQPPEERNPRVETFGNTS